MSKPKVDIIDLPKDLFITSSDTFQDIIDTYKYQNYIVISNFLKEKFDYKQKINNYIAKNKLTYDDICKKLGNKSDKIIKEKIKIDLSGKMSKTIIFCALIKKEDADKKIFDNILYLSIRKTDYLMFIYADFSELKKGKLIAKRQLIFEHCPLLEFIEEKKIKQ